MNTHGKGAKILIVVIKYCLPVSIYTYLQKQNIKNIELFLKNCGNIYKNVLIVINLQKTAEKM